MSAPTPSLHRHGSRSEPHDELPVTLHVERPAEASFDPLVQQLIAEMNQAWRRGERRHAADYVRGCAPLAEQRDAVLRLITEELCLRREAGVTVDEAVLLAEFPQYSGDIRALLACQKLIDDEPGTATPLGKLRDFQLLAELGQGGLGRVYLATQPLLADRPVVVKVTPCRGQEHLSLARVQHTNIVPLYWVHDHPEDDERILCMPYFGSVTLAGLLAELKDTPVEERTGQHILDVLDRSQNLALPPAQARGPARQLLGRATYAQAIAWMGASLADALAYAHARDLLHLDIKPSNILWTTEGQPMLLDFHLARAPITPGEPRPRGLGGTPHYMAPEQEAALNAVCQNQRIAAAVDARADIYSLGLVMYQALGGPVPHHAAHPPRLNDVNPQVSTGLADIVRKCLARDPDQRYASAEALAADLRRHLGDLPLRGVANRSWTERWAKWRRREPQALAALILSIVTALAAAGGGLYLWSERHAQALQDQHHQAERRDRVQRAEQALARAQKHSAAGEYDLARAALDNARALLPAAPEAEAPRRRLEDEERRLERLGRVRLAHDVVNALRLGAVAQELTPAELADLTRAARQLFEHRDRLHSDDGPIDDRLRQDLIDAVVIWSDLGQRGANAGMQADGESRREALRVLDEADAAWGPSVLLDRTRVALLRELGDEPAARKLHARIERAGPQAPWEEIAEARRALLHAPPRPAAASALVAAMGSAPSWMQRAAAAVLSPQRLALIGAAARIEAVLGRAPESFWAHYYHGITAYRLGDFHTARAAFRAAIALSPERAAAWHNRGLAQAQLGAWRQAVLDYTQALTLDGRLAAAALNRAVAHAELGDLAAARADLDLAARLGAPRDLVDRNRAALANRR